MAAPQPSEAVMALEQVSLHVDIYIDPKNVDEFIEHFQPAFDAVVAEDECLYFEVFQDPDDLGHLSWVENWARGVGWLMGVQLQKEYYKPYFEKTEYMYLKPREFSIKKRFGGSLVAQKEVNLKKVD